MKQMNYNKKRKASQRGNKKKCAQELVVWGRSFCRRNAVQGKAYARFNWIYMKLLIF
jgi:hypothetical protein